MTTPELTEWNSPRAVKAENVWIVGLLIALATFAAIGAATFGAWIPALGCTLIALAPAALRAATHLRGRWRAWKSRRQERKQQQS